MLDYESEYSIRGRVPEHPELNAGWARDSAAYREEAAAAGRARFGVPYGPSPRQYLDLFLPENGAKDGPLAVFFHGGYWRGQDPTKFGHVARGLNRRGVEVAVVGYDLCPHVRIGDIIAQVRAAGLFLWRQSRRRFVVYGHSAGGHLSACLCATDWGVLASDVPADLVPAGYGISGVFDLTPLTRTSINNDLRMTEDEARTASPLHWPHLAGRVFDAVVGGIESDEFIRQSRALAEVWARDAETRFEAVPGANHYTVLAPLSDPDSAMTRRVAALCEEAHGLSR